MLQYPWLERWLKAMASQIQETEKEDLLEPFRVRYGQHDLGLHIDIRACLLRAGKEEATNTIIISDTEAEEEKKESNDVTDTIRYHKGKSSPKKG